MVSQGVAMTMPDSKEVNPINLDVAGYRACEAIQRAIINGTETNQGISYLERDRAAEKFVGSIFHPSISINNHTFRGEYEDPNDLFKVICSTLKKRPAICSTISIVDKYMQDQDPRDRPSMLDESQMTSMVYNRFRQNEDKLRGMNRRAKTAEIVLGIVIVLILNCACIAYCKMFNKKKTADRMQIEVNETVS